MPRLRKPESAVDRLVFIKKAVETAQTDNQNGGSPVSAQIIERASLLIPKLENGLGDMSKFQSSSQKEIREKNTALEALKTYIRDSWEVLRRRVYRENINLDVFAFYQLPKNGKSPFFNHDGKWMEMAELIIKGEAAAIEAGYAPMANPSIEELQAKLNEARTEAKDVSDADRQLDQAQEAVAGLMPEAIAIIDRIIAELNFNLYDKEDAGKRRIMRNYGARYEVTKHEMVEDESDITLN